MSAVAVVALYDRVCYKPQEALDATVPELRRITAYFDKGDDPVEIPQSEFDRLTTGPFKLEPAVRKASSDEVKTAKAAAEAEPEPPRSTAGLAITSPNPTPAEGATEAGPSDENAAALNALGFRELRRLANSTPGVTVERSDKKADLVAKLNTAGVRPT